MNLLKARGNVTDTALEWLEKGADFVSKEDLFLPDWVVNLKSQGKFVRENHS